MDDRDAEQVLVLQQWWRHYRALILASVTLAITVALGWSLYSFWHENRMQESAAMYTQLLEDWEQHGARPSRDARQALLAQVIALHEQGSGIYSLYGALLGARMYMSVADAESRESAARLLRDVIARAGGLLATTEESVLLVQARLLLARLETARSNYPAALQQLGLLSNVPAARTLVQDLRGDILSLQGRLDEAVTAYRQALQADLASGGALQQLLTRKLSALSPRQHFFTDKEDAEIAADGNAAEGADSG